MKKNNLIFAIFMTAFLFLACNRNNDPTPEPDPNSVPEFPDNTVDVYLAGYEPNENGINVAKYWKNGIPVVLTNGAFSAKAYYVFISGTDIYVCGTEENQNGKTVAKYWKNGNETILSDGTENAIAFSIALVNSSIYVSGNEIVGGVETARCWINGVATTLPDGAFGTEITFSGNDLYIGGRRSGNDLTKPLRPRCWKNGQIYPLNDTSRSHCSSSKAVGNDIYLAGYEISIYGRNMAKYWKNGSPIILDSNVNAPTYTSGIEVSGSDIYISGSKSTYNASDSSWHSEAGYWKNGTYTHLADEAGTGAISKFNNFLYVCGSVNKKGVLWVNDQILFTTVNNVVFLDIKIVPK